MAKIIGKIMSPTGKYIKDGEEKTSWSRCGVLMQTPNGFRIKLDVIPIGGDGWFTVFEDDDKGSQSQPRSRPAQGQQQVGDQDDIPF